MEVFREGWQQETPEFLLPLMKCNSSYSNKP